MELEELQSRLEHLRHLESRENGPETPQKAYLTMEDSEWRIRRRTDILNS